MRIFLFFLLLSNYSFSQQITKCDIKKIIKNSIKEERRNGYSYHSKIVANNIDSTFFTSKKIKIYSSEVAVRNNDFCRTVQLKFLKNSKVVFIDCQTCIEPSSCYVSTNKNIYTYKIRKRKNVLNIEFTNSFNKINFKIISTTEKKMKGRMYYEIEMERIN